MVVKVLSMRYIRELLEDGCEVHFCHMEIKDAVRVRIQKDGATVFRDFSPHIFDDDFLLKINLREMVNELYNKLSGWEENE